MLKQKNSKLEASLGNRARSYLKSISQSINERERRGERGEEKREEGRENQMVSLEERVTSKGLNK